MTNETLRMQMLAGVITEGEYKAIINKEIEDAEKASLNESMIGGIVGIGAINQIPPREKADYELAFEHFLGERYETKFENREQDPYTMKEEEVEEGNLGHNEMYSIEPEGRFWVVTYKTIEGKKEKIFQSEEDAKDFVKFGINMEEGKEVEEPSNY